MKTGGEVITLAHGSGGKAMRHLIDEQIVTPLSNAILAKLGDSAVLEWPGQRIAFTTDSYVVKPIFFSGGDIGRLAVCGTVNDLAVAGARPLFLSLSIILEEGFPMDDLRKIIGSIHAAACEANIQVVTGDTKVVEKGGADGIFITTSGIGCIAEDVQVEASRAQIGDVIILNGYLGDHGITILSERGEYDFKVNLKSDAAPLSGLIQSLLCAHPDIHFMRDLTRGGLAAALNELALASGKAIEIDEAAIPIRDEVSAVCSLFGFDPLQIANEGKCIVVCTPGTADHTLELMRKHTYGRCSAIIGRIVDYGRPLVFGRTRIQGKRIIGMPSGFLLPRIC